MAVTSNEGPRFCSVVRFSGPLRDPHANVYGPTERPSSQLRAPFPSSSISLSLSLSLSFFLSPLSNSRSGSPFPSLPFSLLFFTLSIPHCCLSYLQRFDLGIISFSLSQFSILFLSLFRVSLSIFLPPCDSLFSISLFLSPMNFFLSTASLFPFLSLYLCLSLSSPLCRSNRERCSYDK